MKIKQFAPLSIGALLTLSIFAFTPKKEVLVKSYSTSSLPTTIDLNDTDVEDIRNYYSSLNDLSDSERQGNNLLKNLKTILKKDQKYYSYDSGDNIWKMYEITDRDWEKSPASSVPGYDSSTNTISGYKYKNSDPYVHALYINRDVDNKTTAWASHKQDEWGINREHVWPKAEGFDTEGASGNTGGARGDPMHLMAGNGYSNNIHSNDYYGYVDTSSSYTDCGTKYSNQKGNLSGTSKTLGGSITVFEPQDSDKGDIARAIFYMVARYNYLSGSDSDGIDSNNPNLALTQSLSDWSSAGYTSSTTKTGKMGIMTDLLAWHHADPVDEYEIHRNNLLYTNFTNNRNPFIDFPEWADFIWGSVVYDGNKYISNDPTPTGKASPLTDSVYDSDITVSVNIVKLKTKATVTLSATTSDNSDITWIIGDTGLISTSKPTSASGESITITSFDKEGKTTLTAKATVGGKEVTKVINITVSNASDEPAKKPVNIVIIIAIAGGAILLIAIIVIIYVNSSKKNKRKMKSSAKRIIKKSTKRK